MSGASDFSLFPNKEEWGTGDEAMDNRLSVALKKVKDDLTFAHISEFYFYGLSLKPRAYNPSFHTTIEFVAKAFLYCLDPEGFNDQLMQKMKGHYDQKKKVAFEFSDVDFIISELQAKKTYRYKSQIDFYLHLQAREERNPFTRELLKRGPLELHTKIILKDFKSWLNKEKENESFYRDAFFMGLRSSTDVLVIDKLGEFWYDEGQIYSLPIFDFYGN